MKKILHEEGDFKLSGRPDRSSWGWDSWMYHYCDGSWCATGWRDEGYCEWVCCRCLALVPNEMVGIWILHNFDHIQKMGAV